MSSSVFARRSAQRNFDTQAQLLFVFHTRRGGDPRLRLKIATFLFSRSQHLHQSAALSVHRFYSFSSSQEAALHKHQRFDIACRQTLLSSIKLLQLKRDDFWTKFYKRKPLPFKCQYVYFNVIWCYVMNDVNDGALFHFLNTALAMPILRDPVRQPCWRSRY